MTEANPPSFPVPKLLWEELENALMIKSKELIYDIAKTLRQEAAPLWKEFRSKKTHVFLVETNEETGEYLCEALVCDMKVAHKCLKPTMFGKNYCPEHEHFVLSEELKKKPQLQRIPSEDTLFLDCLTQQVYNLEYDRIGYLENNKCILFEVEG